MPRVFLSPSTQENNYYVTGGTEEQYMNLLCDQVIPYLQSSGIAYTLQILGQVGTSHAVSSVLLSLESVFGAIGGAILLGERMRPREYLGCAVVFIAVLLAQIDLSTLKTVKCSKLFEKRK